MSRTFTAKDLIEYADQPENTHLSAPVASSIQGFLSQNGIKTDMYIDKNDNGIKLEIRK